jgi:Carboxypeptidase regulatory-like domain/TonB-dependent Receptor Plug Domain
VRVKLTVLCFITFVLFINTAPAQSPTGTVSGIVLDPSGSAIAGAQVLIINEATAVQYPGKANGEGYYVVPNIVPGTYRIQVSNSGFKTIIKPDIIIHVEDALAINFTLPIGAASEIVTVQGGAPLINTENAAVSTVIDRNFVESLPLNGRSFNTLLQLTPGVVIAPISSGFQSGQFSIAGQRTDANNFSVDGVSANFGTGSTARIGQSGTGTSQAFTALGGTSSLASVDVLQEFRIETSSFAPEFGRSPGGQVILTTRSGTNAFHGDAFDYFRNTAMDANNWFSDDAIPQIPKAPEHHNDFGGVVGGPIWKDKTFFFASYEGARLDIPSTMEIQVPYINSAVPSCSPSSAIAPFLEAYPKPNGSVSSTTCTGQFTGAFADKATLDAGSLRIDHTFNGRFSIFGRYNDAPSQIANRTNSLSEIDTTFVNTQTVTVGVNMTVSSRLFNALRGNYSTQRAGLSQALDTFGGAIPPDPSVLFGSLPPGQSGAYFLPLDGTYAYSVGTNATNKSKQLNFVDDLSFTVGAHQLKFGGDYRAIFLDNVPLKNDFLYLALSVQDLISTGQVFLFIPSNALPARILSQSTSLYAQDNWKASRRLVLTYGVRWELSPAPQGLGSTRLASWLNLNNPSAIALAPAGNSVWHTTYGNLAPRFGVAYSLDEADTMVFRAGAGVFYDLGVGASANLAGLFPNTASGGPYYFQPLPVVNIASFVPTISAMPPYPADGTEGFDPNLKLPRSYQWNVALEKSFGGRQTISATYAGQAGRDLLRQEALYQPNTNFSGAFELTGNGARSNYNALQLQYRRPFASRLQALLNYTYSHSLDNASNDVIAGLSNTVISAANDYASSDFDVRQSFSGALTFAVPSVGRSGVLAVLTRDWSLDTVIVARTGFPVNPEVSAPSSLGAEYVRPDRVPGQPFYVYGTQCAQVFGPVSEGGNGALETGQMCPGGMGLNPAAFDAATPVAENRQGTLGRNAIPGFGLTQVDLSIGRKFAITERLHLQFRADAFNLLNHPNFTNPPGNLSGLPSLLLSRETLNTGLGGLNPLFQEGGPRSLQLSLRLAF